jgi:hypothetical protein
MSPNTVDLRDPSIAEPIVGILLDPTFDSRYPWAALHLRVFREALRSELVRAARIEGSVMSVGAVLSKMVGDEAVAQLALASDARMLFDRLFGTSSRLRGEDSNRKRQWKARPFEVYEEQQRAGLVLHYVIAPDPYEPQKYTKWCLYTRTVGTVGITAAGSRAMLRMFGHHGKTFRVLLDGAVLNVRCLPVDFTLLTITAFRRLVIQKHPEWTVPAHRENLEDLANGGNAALRAVTTNFLGFPRP